MGEMVVALFSFLFQDWGDNQVWNSQHNASWILIYIGFSSWPSASPSSWAASCGSYCQSLQGNNKSKDCVWLLAVGNCIFCIINLMCPSNLWKAWNFVFHNFFKKIYILPLTPFQVAPFRGPHRGGEEDLQQGSKDEQEGDIKGASGEGLGHQPGILTFSI